LGFIFRLLTMLAVAIAIGFGASYYALTDGRIFGAVREGPWAGWPQIGQPVPDPYSRAYLARAGLMQLGQAEGIQFTAFTDNEGEPLDLACNYRLTGRVPGASFWTIVATDEDGTLMAAPDGQAALHSERIAYGADGSINAAIGPRLAAGNWLETAGRGPFWLTLTLYDAAIFSGGTSTISEMPQITREAC